MWTHTHTKWLTQEERERERERDEETDRHSVESLELPSVQFCVHPLLCERKVPREEFSLSFSLLQLDTLRELEGTLSSPLVTLFSSVLMLAMAKIVSEDNSQGRFWRKAVTVICMRVCKLQSCVHRVNFNWSRNSLQSLEIHLNCNFELCMLLVVSISLLALLTTHYSLLATHYFVISLFHPLPICLLILFYLFHSHPLSLRSLPLGQTRLSALF